MYIEMNNSTDEKISFSSVSYTCTFSIGAGQESQELLAFVFSKGGTAAAWSQLLLFYLFTF